MQTIDQTQVINLRGLFIDRGLLLTRKLLNQSFLLTKKKSSLRKICGRHHDLFDRYGISVSRMNTYMFPLSSALSSPFIIHDVSQCESTILPRRVSLVEQELFTLQGHPRLPPVLTRSLVVCACFVNCCLFFCMFSFGHCAVCSLRYADSDYPFGIFKLFPQPVSSGVCVTRGLVLFNALLICVCTFVLFLLNIVLSVDFRLMIHPVVSTNMFSYEYLLQCYVIYL